MGFMESFNGKPRDGCLNANQVLSTCEALWKIEAWRVDHRPRRPRSSLGHLTPRLFLNRSERSACKGIVRHQLRVLACLLRERRQCVITG
jgi:hypothetical protein